MKQDRRWDECMCKEKQNWITWSRSLPCFALMLALGQFSFGECSSQAMKNIEQSVEGKLGVSAVVEGQKAFEYHGRKHFPMQSVYKLPIAIAVLHEIEQGRLELNRTVHVQPEQMIPPAGHSPLRDKFHDGGEFTVEDLLRRAIVDSDGSASDVLLRVIGGPKTVQRFLREKKIKGVRVKHTEAQIIEDAKAQYEDSATPEGMTGLLLELKDGKLLNEKHTRLLLEWMRESQTGKDRLRAKLPAGTVVEDKTGSSGTSDGKTAATNDVGLVMLPDGKAMAVAVFVMDSRANVAARNGAIAEVGRVMWECWAK